MDGEKDIENQDKEDDFYDEEDEEAKLHNSVIEEYEYYESFGSIKIHESLQVLYKELLTKFKIHTKIFIFRLLTLFDYDTTCSYQLANILDICPVDHIDWIMIELCGCMNEKERVEVILQTISSVDRNHMIELVTNITTEEFHRLIDILLFSTNIHRKLFIQLLFDLSFREVFNLIQRYDDELETKSCRLCRLRRIDVLEYHLLKNDYDKVKKSIRVTGALKINDSSELWTAPDENKFTFDYEQQHVLWNKKDIIDLVQICDICLQDVYGAISIVNRREPIYSLETNQRSEVMESQRQEEQQRAKLIMNISNERIYRRAKEWIESSMKLYRKGIKEYELLQQKLEQERIENQRRIEEIITNNQMIEHAMKIDRKWKRFDIQSGNRSIKASYSYAMLKFHNGFDIRNPKSFKRENPLSWNWKPFDEDGTPLTQEAVHSIGKYVTTASSIFTASPRSQHRIESKDTSSKNKQLKILGIWKDVAMTKHNKYLQDVEENTAKQRKSKEEEYQYYLNYINQRNNDIDHKYAIIRRELDEEMNRIHKQRIVDREQRRLLRLQYLEHCENKRMYYEDVQTRVYENSLLEEARERKECKNMMMEEREQCKIDRYWGIDKHEEELLSYYRIVKESYIQRVKNANDTIVETRKLSSNQHVIRVANTTKKMITHRSIHVDEKHVREEALRLLRLSKRIS